MNSKTCFITFAVTALFFCPAVYAQFDLTPAFKTFEEERAEVAKQHEGIVKQFGGEAGSPELRAYVDRVGQIVAKNSASPPPVSRPNRVLLAS